MLIEKPTPAFRTPFNYDTDLASDEAGLYFDGSDGKAQQQFKDECDINTIVRRFGLTGELPNDVRVPQYADFTDAVSDYQTALHQVIAADREFMRLPPDLRYRFRNDPQQLLEFVSDESNRDEAQKLGLLKAPVPEAEPIKVRVMADVENSSS